MSVENLKTQHNSNENPEDQAPAAKPITDLESYELHQSFFTKSDLQNEHEFKIVKYERKPDSLEPVLQVNEVMYMGGTHMGLYHGWGILITKTATY